MKFSKDIKCIILSEKYQVFKGYLFVIKLRYQSLKKEMNDPVMSIFLDSTKNIFQFSCDSVSLADG